jgi:hypothetical protein
VFPTGTIVTIVANDRLRKAETARLARSVTATDEQPQWPRRGRRLRAFATRIAFATQR